MGDMMEQRAGFKSMKESTKADWAIIAASIDLSRLSWPIGFSDI